MFERNTQVVSSNSTETKLQLRVPGSWTPLGTGGLVAPVQNVTVRWHYSKGHWNSVHWLQHCQFVPFFKKGPKGFSSLLVIVYLNSDTPGQ